VFGGTVDDCRVENVGACWVFIASRDRPSSSTASTRMTEYWRPNLVFALLAAAGHSAADAQGAVQARQRIGCSSSRYPVVSLILLIGGVFGLEYVPTEQWGGLLVTLIISVVGICLSLPLGILLALGRRSKLPIIKTLCVCFIELDPRRAADHRPVHGLVMLPLFMPQGVTVDKLLRAWSASRCLRRPTWPR
jgi:general L-amino acid transport system permease protein